MGWILIAVIVTISGGAGFGVSRAFEWLDDHIHRAVNAGTASDEDGDRDEHDHTLGLDAT